MKTAVAVSAVSLILSGALAAPQSPIGRLEGTVKGTLAARPMGGVQVLLVRLESDSSRTYSTRVDGRGRFHVDSLPTGHYLVQVSHPTLDSLDMALPTDRLVIADGRTTRSDLSLPSGAVLRDMEFVQFHPTALDVGRDPMPLVSEAVRGEGAILVDEGGERLMAGHSRGELEPRDIVTRAMWRHIAEGHRVFLDARTALGADFAERFPVIAAHCHAAGIDPGTMPIPVRPAAQLTDASCPCSVRVTTFCSPGPGDSGGDGLAPQGFIAPAQWAMLVAWWFWYRDSCG